MCMGVMALADVGNSLADVMAVLENRIALADVAKRDLVTERDGVQGLDGQGFIGFHQPARKLLSGLDPLNHDNANAILGFMDQKIWF